ncbi:hypothetical protein [Streptomyces sp. NPDC046939]|uniref:hypothetical protein n=1 Tax=Streptomyces sp. NPDC046939 TaxID=3155376 RepID=UPI0033CA4E49
MSSRRLAVLIQHLPQEAALTHALHGEAAAWGVTEHLLAHVVDRLAEANWMFAMVNQGEDGDPPEFPEPLKRPGQQDPDTDAAGVESSSASALPGPEELVRFFS